MAAEADLGELKERRKPRSLLRTLAPYAAAAAILGAGVWFAFQQSATDKTNTPQTAAAPMPGISLTMANGQTVHFHPDSAAQTVSLGDATLRSANGRLDYESADTSVTVLNVPAGGTYRLVLSDGTEVWLNASTRLHFPFHFGKQQREVTLEGEAYFRVARETERPFIVHTPQSDVRVWERLSTLIHIRPATTGPHS